MTTLTAPLARHEDALAQYFGPPSYTAGGPFGRELLVKTANVPVNLDVYPASWRLRLEAQLGSFNLAGR